MDAEERELVDGVEPEADDVKKPEPEGNPAAEAADDRPEKNIKAEIARKVEKAVAERDSIISQLKEQVEGIQKGQSEKQIADETASLEAKLAALGYDKEMLDLVDSRWDQKIKRLESKFNQDTAQIKNQLYASSKNSYLKEIKDSDRTGMVAKHYDDIKSVIEELDPELWSSKEGMTNVVKMVLGDIVLESPAEAKSSKSSAPTADSPTSAPSKAKKSAKKSTIDSFREQYGLDDEQASEVAAASDELDKVFY